MKNVILILASVIVLNSCSVMDTNETQNTPVLSRTVGQPWGFIGGSITYGTGASTVANQWVHIVANGVPYINYGVPGFTTFDNVNRIDGLIAMGPSIIFIDESVNDAQYVQTLERYEELKVVFASMIDKIKNAGITPIVVDFNYLPEYAVMINDLSWESLTCRAHREVAQSRGVFYLNIGRQVANWCKVYGVPPIAIVPDTIHPGDTGHYLYATLIRQYFGY